MNLFETVKAAVTVRQTAEHYGLRPGRNGMVCCPFHIVLTSSISFVSPQGGSEGYGACEDDDMRMEALRQTNYVKSIVTAQGKMDLERKGKQSYQGWMFARLLAFSNGDLQALYDRSDGFYRRQLVLTTREKPVGRIDDPDLAEKMKAEAEGIFLWAFAGLRRLIANNLRFTESQRTKENRESVKRGNNNIFDSMESDGYIRRKANASISSKDFYEIYRMWCEENSLTPLKRRCFSDRQKPVVRCRRLQELLHGTTSCRRADHGKRRRQFRPGQQRSPQ